MKGQTDVLLFFCLWLLFTLESDVEGRGDRLLNLPGALLLFGYGPTNLQVATPTDAWKLQPTGNEPASWGHHIFATLSQNGSVVASARLKSVGEKPLQRIPLQKESGPSMQPWMNFGRFLFPRTAQS